MTDLQAILIFGTSLCTLATAIVGVFMSLLTKKAVQEVHVSLDGRLTQLLKAEKATSHAAGVVEGASVNGS